MVDSIKGGTDVTLAPNVAAVFPVVFIWFLFSLSMSHSDVFGLSCLSGATVVHAGLST